MKLAYQLYSSRHFPPLDSTLKELAGIGYTQVEGFGGLYDNLENLTSALQANGLTMPTGHFGLDMLQQQRDRVLEIADATGMQSIFCPFVEAGSRPQNAPGWRQFGAELDELGETYRNAGLVFGWHNHDFEFASQSDGCIPMNEILTGGPGLAWEADIAWIVRAGADPLDWIARHGDRLAAVHVKDLAPQGQCIDEDGWADVGQGTIDWRGLLTALGKSPTILFVMEHDNPSDDMRFAQQSHAYVQSLNLT